MYTVIYEDKHNYGSVKRQDFTTKDKMDKFLKDYEYEFCPLGESATYYIIEGATSITEDWVDNT